jgi:membrane associated rhomboid family serine protease
MTERGGREDVSLFRQFTSRYYAPAVRLFIILNTAIETWSEIDASARAGLMTLAFTPAHFSIHPWQSAYTLVTASFVHADIFHVAGNILFLWVFGRSLERLFASWLFLLAFPFLGVVGFLSQWLLDPTALTPIVGASGSIAALLGAYLVLFPRARMRVLLLWFPLWKRRRGHSWAFG